MKDGRAELNKRFNCKQRLMSAAVTLVITAALLGFVFGVWLLGVRVDDDGMAPTISRGDVIFFNRLSHFVRAPKRGDIIAYRDANGVKLGRIAALPGEAVQAEGGKLYIDGILLDERIYADFQNPDMPETVLSENEYFLMPDARAAMLPQPSRMTIHVDDFVGRAWIRVTPISNFGIFE